jgi:Bacterial self-protective colicin-like immunity
MEDYGEVGVPEFLQLMKGFIEMRISARNYRETYFTLMKRRMILSEEESRILQQAYGDADDYDPTMMLHHTIDELELRERVAKSIGKLSALGYAVGPEP